MFRFDNTYSRLPEKFYARALPAKVSKPGLIKWNSQLARQLGAQTENLNEDELAAIFAGQKPLPGSDPIALVYAGHQFGYFVPRLGDGRALLLGEILGPSEKRYDIQLKGSGKTPFSRRGDGKAPLGPVLREYLVSEGLYYLGLPTSRSLAAVETGEPVFRETTYPGAVLTRVASSHIRVGTFEYFAAQKDLENLKILTQYAIKRHYPDIQEHPGAHLQFFRRVGHAQVELVTGWMALGFIHGVMNTDNMSIAGETIDFGPCAFMDRFRFHQVFSSIDQFGRYAYSNQGQITLWNLSRLGNCLILLTDDDSKEGIRIFNEELESFGNLFEQRLAAKMRKKLGILNGEQPEDKDIIRKWLVYLEAEALDYTLSFRHLSGLVKKDAHDDFFEKTEAFQNFYQLWQQRIQNQNLETREIQEQMNRVNPIFIPRNHKIQQVIESALAGDFSLFHEMTEALRKPYREQVKFRSYQRAPEPEEVVHATFCGT